MIYFGTPDGRKISPLGEVKDIELTPEESAECKKWGRAADSFECEIKLEAREDGLDPWRILASGGDKSTYNAMTLKEEGKLTPENGWL